MNESKEFYKNEYHIQYAIHDSNYFIYGYIKRINPKTLFEFGCNAGRHLNMFRTIGIKTFGIDINAKAIEASKSHFKLQNTRIGDEETLKTINIVYDIVYTNSVLCHIPNIDQIIRDFKRIAKHIIIFEAPKQNGKHWYQHKYEEHGFNEVWRYHAPEVDAKYKLYEMKCQ